jgi:acyl-CoA dehydrogenase
MNLRTASAQILPLSTDLQERANAVATTAAQHAAAVDRDARFPAEAIAGAKAQRLLGILVPVELGGEGTSISDTVDVCYALGRGCASTGMIYAMHQMMVACLVRHAKDSAWHREFLRRLCSEQLLLASSTTEGQGGGDLRKSQCAVEQNGAGITVEKSATVVSYGAEADAIVTTARRSPDAAASDQVLVAFEKGSYELEHLVGWDTLGMRGTCSSGFVLRGRGAPEQVLPEAYQTIHAQTGMPVAHLMWSATWTGIAASAVERARAFLRMVSRKSNGQMPPGAPHLTRATLTLSTLRAAVTSAARRYEAIATGDEQQLESLEFQASMNLLKVTASELAISVVNSTLQATGLAGYRNDGDFSVTRQLRDALSSSVMINNDRIIANVASTSLLVDVPARLTA